jgi:selenocysteine lyase/cysteine desulfurase
MSYQQDTIEQVYDEIAKLEAEILTASASLKTLGEKEAEAIANYENKKNGYLIQLYAEESDANFKGKRTEAHRTAMYRKMFEIERLQRQLAIHDLSAQRDYIKSLLAVLNSTQSRLRVLESERKLAEYAKG